MGIGSEVRRNLVRGGRKGEGRGEKRGGERRRRRMGERGRARKKQEEEEENELEGGMRRRSWIGRELKEKEGSGHPVNKSES